VTFSKVVA